MNLANKVLIALITGILFGLLINSIGLSTIPWIDTYLIHGLFQVIGKIFVNALQMLVVPLVLLSLIPGIVGIGDVSLLGKIGTKSVALYLVTTAIAIATAIAFAAAFGIGQGVELPLEDAFAGKVAGKSFIDILIGIVPKNIFAALANNAMLSIIFFSIFFGIALLSVKKQAPSLLGIIEELNAVIMRMIDITASFSPYAKISTFLQKARSVQVFGFSTASSAATIPVTLRTAQERMGVNQAVSSFTVPFGATINMDGTAMMQGAATVFIANLYGVDLGLGGYLTVIITAVLASIGTAAVPSAGLVMLTIVFAQVGLPVEAIGLILGVDRILDMTRTAVNLTGDLVVTTVVAKSENSMDVDVFNDPGAGVIYDAVGANSG